MSIENKVLTLVKPIIGQKCYRAALGMGQSLILDFGNELELWKRGEWSIWVWGCAWRIEKLDGSVVGSGDTEDNIKAFITVLVGLSITDIKVQHAVHDLSATFENGVILHTFMYCTEQQSECYDGWMVFTSDLHVISVGPGVSWEHEKSMPLKKRNDQHNE
ncbi:MAG: hypothetical protein HC915_02930 [Anaerolineae bacterium]|nr:hypothetical protein [Anaerolineae bacterium]